MTGHEKKQKRMTQTQEKSSQWKLPEWAQMLDLADKDFKAADKYVQIIKGNVV